MSSGKHFRVDTTATSDSCRLPAKGETSKLQESPPRLTGPYSAGWNQYPNRARQFFYFFSGGFRRALAYRCANVVYASGLGCLRLGPLHQFTPGRWNSTVTFDGLGHNTPRIRWRDRPQGGALVLPLSLPLAVVMLTALLSVHFQYGFSSIIRR
jgi:hypothetical protein